MKLIKNNISIYSDKCTGCGLCQYTCNLNAISINENKSKCHFMFPFIDKEKCINCGRCVDLCPLSTCHKIEENSFKKIVYSFQRLNWDKLKLSSSGGAFSFIAEQFLKQNGVVYGASWSKNMQVMHKRIVSIDDLPSILGSKYIQSFLNKDIFISVKKDIESGKNVLFSGTPCQIAAINSLFLNNIPKNLFTIEVICHGVGNQYGFDKCIKFEEKKNKCVVNSFQFRYKKEINKNNRAFRYTYFKKGNTYEVIGDNSFFVYYKLFQNQSIYRESCYDCQFRGENRVSDITLGDFWGITNIDKTIKSNFDHSMVIVNTIKGESILDCNYFIKKYSFDICKLLNESYLKNIDKNKIDYSFYENANKYFLLKIKYDHHFFNIINIYLKNFSKFCFNFLFNKKSQYNILYKKHKIKK